MHCRPVGLLLALTDQIPALQCDDIRPCANCTHARSECISSELPPPVKSVPKPLLLRASGLIDSQETPTFKKDSARRTHVG
jgi:hypothetical protein